MEMSENIIFDGEPVIKDALMDIIEKLKHMKITSRPEGLEVEKLDGEINDIRAVDIQYYIYMNMLYDDIHRQILAWCSQMIKNGTDIIFSKKAKLSNNGIVR